MAYNDPENQDVKLYSHMLLALAYVPPDDVEEVLRMTSPGLSILPQTSSRSRLLRQNICK